MRPASNGHLSRALNILSHTSNAICWLAATGELYLIEMLALWSCSEQVLMEDSARENGVWIDGVHVLTSYTAR